MNRNKSSLFLLSDSCNASELKRYDWIRIDSKSSGKTFKKSSGCTCMSYQSWIHTLPELIRTRKTSFRAISQFFFVSCYNGCMVSFVFRMETIEILAGQSFLTLPAIRRQIRFCYHYYRFLALQKKKKCFKRNPEQVMSFVRLADNGS